MKLVAVSKEALCAWGVKPCFLPGRVVIDFPMAVYYVEPDVVRGILQRRFELTEQEIDVVLDGGPIDGLCSDARRLLRASRMPPRRTRRVF
jgi:hypothetical protein